MLNRPPAVHIHTKGKESGEFIASVKSRSEACVCMCCRSTGTECAVLRPESHSRGSVIFWHRRPRCSGTRSFLPSCSGKPFHSCALPAVASCIQRGANMSFSVWMVKADSRQVASACMLWTYLCNGGQQCKFGGESTVSCICILEEASLGAPLCTSKMIVESERRVQCWAPIYASSKARCAMLRGFIELREESNDVQGPSAQTLSASSYSATVPRVQAAGLASTKSTGRPLPTSADVFNLGEGIASLLGRRLLSQG